MKIEESLQFLGMIQSLPAPEFTLIADQNWMEAWKRHYKPLAIGRRLMIVPAWLEVNQAGRIPIRINPGMAFGTGTHPSTQLCLELIEGALDALGAHEHSAADDGVTGFIDVGCGSGILSIAALKLGATFALGVDIDPDSITNARENAALNGIGSELVLGVGSLQDILDGKFPNRTASVVAVNILAPVIVRLFAEGLGELVQEHGAIILGGILRDQAESVLSAAREANVRPVERRQMGDWIALRMGR